MKSNVSRAIITFLILAVFVFFCFPWMSAYFKFHRLLGNLDHSISSYTAYSMGNLYAGRGQYKEAIKSYRTALKLNSKMAICYYKLAIVYDTLGNKYESTYCYQQFIALKPDGRQLDRLNSLIKRE